MSITITKTINKCAECRHIGHSGAFTPGGAKPICSHPDASYSVGKIKGITGDKKYNWKHRVIPYKRVEGEFTKFGGPRITRVPKGTIPNWCPLKKGWDY